MAASLMDFSIRMRSSEEVVAGIIDDVLTEGGHMLWQKYLQRKAFPFAAETATDVLVSQLRMCFVAHDRGEPDDETDAEDWSLETEPIPAEVDNWARMQLTVRRKQKRYTNDMSPVVNNHGRKLQSQRSRVSDARTRAKSGIGQNKQSESRSFDLKEEIQLDDEEEKLRDARQQEEAKRRERENKVRQNEKAKEVEQQRVQALHEEMSRRQHTFDSNGDLIWVEDLKLERLPPTQQVFPFYVKRDPRAKGAELDSTAGKAAGSPAAKKAAKQRGRLNRTGKAEDDFPDGFSKLQHGQPPILETMVVKPGVVLDVYGKSKSGPAVVPTGVGMSRKEYVTLTEKEVAHEAQFASLSDPSGEDGRAGSPDHPPGTAGSRSMPGDVGLGATGSAAGEDGLLPPIGGASGASGTSRGNASRGGTRGNASTGASAFPAEGGKKAEVQTAPPAPSQSVRSKKMQAIGHLGQPPRLHVAPLGGPYGFGVAQPPLGATMGHGLVRHGSMKESYFFPSNSPEMPSLLRASSETSFGPKGRQKLAALPLSRGGSREESRSQTAPSKSLMDLEGGGMSDEESPRHGMIRAEKKSQAYRGMRQTLFPNTLAAGYVSGMP